MHSLREDLAKEHTRLEAELEHPGPDKEELTERLNLVERLQNRAEQVGRGDSRFTSFGVLEDMYAFIREIV